MHSVSTVDNFMTMQGFPQRMEAEKSYAGSSVSGLSFMELVKNAGDAESNPKIDENAVSFHGNIQKKIEDGSENSESGSFQNGAVQSTSRKAFEISDAEKSENSRDEGLEQSKKNLDGYKVSVDLQDDSSQTENLPAAEKKILNERYSVLEQIAGMKKNVSEGKKIDGKSEKLAEKEGAFFDKEAEDVFLPETGIPDAQNGANLAAEIIDFSLQNQPGTKVSLKNDGKMDSESLEEALKVNASGGKLEALEGRAFLSEEGKTKKVKFGEKIAFDVTDLRTKVYETDETQQDVQLTASKGEISSKDLKGQVQYSGGNDIQMTFSINQNLALSDITSSNSQAAGAAGSNFQAMLENLIENNAQDFARAGSIVLKDNNAGSISLILHPESLGNVKINLELSDKVVTGHITVASKEAMAAFEGSLNSLKNAFSQGGFDNASFDLSMAGQNAGGFGSSSQGDSRNMQNLSDRLYGDLTVEVSAGAADSDYLSYGKVSDYSVDIVA